MKNLLEPKSLLDVRKWKDKASRSILKSGMKHAHDKAMAEFASVVERVKKNRHARNKAV